jgi:hypothetical protein
VQKASFPLKLVAYYSVIWQTADRIHVTDPIERSIVLWGCSRDVLDTKLLVEHWLGTEVQRAMADTVAAKLKPVGLESQLQIEFILLCIA